MSTDQTQAVSVICGDGNCGHALFDHDMNLKAMPCRVPGCECGGFTDRGWL